MNLRIVTILITLLTAKASALTNLIVNGDFTSTLTPWVGTAGVFGGKAVINTGSLTQTFATKPGVAYYLSFDLVNTSTSSVAVIATPTGGADQLLNLQIPQGGIHKSAVFTATSDSVDLSFTSTEVNPFPQQTLDNVRVIEITANALAGKYTGIISEKTQLLDHPLTNTVARKVTAIIDASSKLYLLDGASVLYSGVVFPDKTFEIAAKGKIRTGNAILKGRRLTFSFADTTQFTDEGANTLDLTITTTVVITKTGKLPAQ